MEFWKVSTRKFENFGRKIWNWKNQPMRSRKVSIERFWGIMSLVIQFGKFRSKDSELEDTINEISESFDRNIWGNDVPGYLISKVSIESFEV